MLDESGHARSPEASPHDPDFYGKDKPKANGVTDEFKGLDNLAHAVDRPSIGVKRRTGSDDFWEALEALDLKAGQQPSQKSLQDASAWISLEDDESVL